MCEYDSIKKNEYDNFYIRMLQDWNYLKAKASSIGLYRLENRGKNIKKFSKKTIVIRNFMFKK